MDAFWELAYPAVKPLEVLLARDDITLIDVLDDRNLFLECKEKNQKLIDYLSKSDNLKQLLSFVTEVSKHQTANPPKYQHIAAEVLCSDIDEFVDGALANDNALLCEFWDLGMHSLPSPEDSVLMSQFCKVFVAFLTRKPHEIFSFIQSQPSALKDILRHIELPQVADLLLKILLLDREPTRAPVVDWLCEQQLMKLLLQNLSAERGVAVHQSTLELIKNIILMSSFTPTPGRKEASVLSSNKLSRDLVSPSNSELLISQLFPNIIPPSLSSDKPPSTRLSNTPTDIENQVSSIMSTASVIMELIRKNNSDYFEQYLFLRAREHLMSIQEGMLAQRSAEEPVDDLKPVLEAAMEDIMAKCGLVNLGALISAICDHLPILQERLKKPFSLVDPIPSTAGPTVPLTLERLRICELYGELLHYSNMLLPNRTPGTSPSYDVDGRLIGGLDALGDLAAAMMAEVDPDAEVEEEEEEEEEEEVGKVEQEEEEPPFPVSQKNRKRRSFASDSDSDGSSMLNEEVKRESPSPAEIEAANSQDSLAKGSTVSPASSIENLVDRLSLVVPGSPKQRKPSISPFTPGTPAVNTYSKAGSVIAQPIEPEVIVDDVLEDEPESAQAKPPGDILKSRFLELRIFSTLLDLVFQFPWNNLLHSVVYDILHQVLFGKTEGTMNRDLIINLFRGVELPRRILDAQNVNDSQPSTQPRLGYMGHISLMAVDIVGALEKYPDDLLAIIEPLIPQPAWDNYVHGVYAETQRLENTILGGPRPAANPQTLQTRIENGWGGDWNDDAEATSPVQTFRRTGAASRQTADFGPPDEDEEGDFHFKANSGFENETGLGPGSGSDSGDEHDEWLRSSNSATLVSRHSRDVEEVGFENAFEDDFQPLEGVNQEYRFDDDDGFGDFTNAESPATHFSANFEHEDFDFGEFKSGFADTATTEAQKSPTRW